ncbi:MAG: PqqD family protein [Candidatus Omnitrophota bacterium]
MIFPKYVKVRQERFGAVVFDTLKEKVFVSNQTGAGILRLLGEGKSMQDICEELSKGYDMAPAQLSVEVNNFVDELHRRELLI